MNITHDTVYLHASELFLFNSKRVIFDCNHGKNKFVFFDEKMIMKGKF